MDTSPEQETEKPSATKPSRFARRPKALTPPKGEEQDKDNETAAPSPKPGSSKELSKGGEQEPDNEAAAPSPKQSPRLRFKRSPKDNEQDKDNDAAAPSPKPSPRSKRSSKDDEQGAENEAAAPSPKQSPRSKRSSKGDEEDKDNEDGPDTEQNTRDEESRSKEEPVTTARRRTRLRAPKLFTAASPEEGNNAGEDDSPDKEVSVPKASVHLSRKSGVTFRAKNSEIPSEGNFEELQSAPSQKSRVRAPKQSAHQSQPLESSSASGAASVDEDNGNDSIQAGAASISHLSTIADRSKFSGTAFQKSATDSPSRAAPTPTPQTQKQSQPITRLKTVAQAAMASSKFEAMSSWGLQAKKSQQEPSQQSQQKEELVNTFQRDFVREEVQRARNDGRMSEAEVDRLRELFTLADTDNSETISESELKALMAQAYNITPSQQELSGMMRDADVDGSGGIDFQEFLYVFLRIRSGDIQCKAWEKIQTAAQRIQSFLRARKSNFMRRSMSNASIRSEASVVIRTGGADVFLDRSSASSQENNGRGNAQKRTSQEKNTRRGNWSQTCQQKVEQALLEGKLPGAELDSLRNLFRAVDTDNSDSISESELAELVRQGTGAAPTADELRHMMSVVDIDGSGEVDFYEFLYLFLSLRDGTVPCRALCKMHDAALRIQKTLRGHKATTPQGEPTEAAAALRKSFSEREYMLQSARIHHARSELQSALENLQQCGVNSHLLQQAQALQQQLEMEARAPSPGSRSSSSRSTDWESEVEDLEHLHELDGRALRQKLREVTQEVHEHRGKVAKAESLLDTSSAVQEAEAAALAILRDERDALLEDRKQVKAELKRVQGSILHWRQHALQRSGSLAQREEEQGKRALRGVVLTLSAMRDVLLPHLDVVFPRGGTLTPSWEEEVARKFLGSCQPPGANRVVRSRRAASSQPNEVPRWVERLSPPRQNKGPRKPTESEAAWRP
eukprot:gnl/MRDRNA2_/MRDRNA2_28419_c0_seq1.p1 gnl/MRDRNA2_/MRDRNA2_28419_c0~~gnl/MRDRNA2_/MRDRNA2_28419_c0_seq1.p1  ORF type:complete len:963 (+),score=226.17 gnl/MRDRNA2_/MRDRNA2_28419_c0_seq1:154-3042(+)